VRCVFQQQLDWNAATNLVKGLFTYMYLIMYGL